MTTRGRAHRHPGLAEGCQQSDGPRVDERTRHQQPFARLRDRADGRDPVAGCDGSRDGHRRAVGRGRHGQRDDTVGAGRHEDTVVHLNGDACVDGLGGSVAETDLVHDLQRRASGQVAAADRVAGTETGGEVGQGSGRHHVDSQLTPPGLGQVDVQRLEWSDTAEEVPEVVLEAGCRRVHVMIPRRSCRSPTGGTTTTGRTRAPAPDPPAPG